MYPTHRITDPSTHNYFEVVPSRGGIITSWVVGGKELFYMDQERYANPQLSIRGGNPILFPICGNLPDNTYTYGGNTYHLKQHGFARDRAWTLVHRTDQSATLELTSDGETLKVYPFAFSLKITYRLAGNTLIIEQACTNLSPQPMPYSIGFHPYFAITNKASIDLKIPAQTLWNNVAKQVETYTGSLDFGLPEIDSAFYLDADARKVTMTADDRQLTITFDEHYRIFVVWTLQDKNYLCLEPWTGGRNAINTGEHLLYLPSNATQCLRVEYNYTAVV